MVQGPPKLLGRRKTVGSKTLGSKTVGDPTPERFDAGVTLEAVAREWLLELRVMGRSPRTIVSETFRRLRARTGMAVRAHKLRHTLATEYLRNCGDIERLRRILGHTTYVMVMRYVHLDKSDLYRDFNSRSPF